MPPATAPPRIPEGICQRILDTTPDAFWITNLDGRFLQVNNQCSRLLGYSRGELLQLSIYDIDTFESPEQTSSRIRQIIQRGSDRFETILLGKDGHLVEVEVSSHYAEADGGTLTAFVRDISKQKKLESELRAERDLSRRYLEIASVLFVVLNDRQEITLINRKGCEILGYDRDELIGANWFDTVIPKEETPVVKEVFDRLIAGEVALVENFANNVVTKSGEKRLVAWTNNYVCSDDGAITSVISCGRDITEQKRAEERIIEEKNKLDAVMAALDEGITVQDKQFSIVYQNKKHCDLQGDHLGEYCYQAYHGRREICPGCLLVKTFADGKVHRREVKAQDRNGEILYLEVTACPVIDAKNTIVAGIEAVRDISERKKLEQEVQRARNLESLGIFAGGIAHDFNNLLTAVLGNLSLAQKQVRADSDILPTFSAMESACIRAQLLTKQLLTFAKGGAPVIDTTSIVETIINSTNFVLTGSNVKVETDITQELWNVEADCSQISQVIQNLAQNAAQAMPEGGILKISAENTHIRGDDPLPLKIGPYVKLTFTDSGHGVEPQNLTRIFDPYFTTKEQGSGLGLAVAFSIINKHHGHLTVASAPGQGATFSLWLPAAPGTSPVSQPQTAPAGLPSGQGHILVMDDQELIRDLAVAMLETLGYAADVACDGDEMLEMYRTAGQSGNPYDLVIMDLTIPGGLGGKEAIRKLQELFPDAKAIVSSGYSNDPVISNHQEYGFCGYIEKPFTLNQLGETLEKTLADIRQG